MALDAGTTNADAGMSGAIYQAIDAQFATPLRDAITNAKDDAAKKIAQQNLSDAQQNWQKLAYCIAKGVVEHIKSNMEITGIQSSGTVSGNRVNTQQSGATTGLVR